MELIILGVFIIILVLIILVFAISNYNKFQAYIIRINEAESNIDAVLRKRFDLLNKSVNIIKKASKNDESVLENIETLKSKKLSNFELDRKLYDSIKEFHEYKEKYPKLKKNEAFVKIDVELNESEAEIVAFRKYYNDMITEYNKLVKSFPSNVLALIFKFKSKLYFDGKDMSDENIKDFKL